MGLLRVQNFIEHAWLVVRLRLVLVSMLVV
jgi:hypothetical protein